MIVCTILLIDHCVNNRSITVWRLSTSVVDGGLPPVLFPSVVLPPVLLSSLCCCHHQCCYHWLCPLDSTRKHQSKAIHQCYASSLHRIPIHLILESNCYLVDILITMAIHEIVLINFFSNEVTIQCNLV